MFNETIWSSLFCQYPIFLMVLVNLSNNALGDCLSPYNPFFSLHTLFVAALLNPGGGSINTSSSKSLWRKAFFTSNCCKFYPKHAAKDNKIHTVVTFITSANVSKVIYPIGLRVPLSYHPALYLSNVPSALYFKLNTHPLPKFYSSVMLSPPLP